MKEMGKSKALVINTIASIVTFAVGLGIAFFFTPYLTDTVGEEAYGFVSLGNNVINYITIVTIALNSVAGRFITIEYHKGNKKEASEYFTSVLAANLVIIPAILLITVPAIAFAEKLVHIPEELVGSVKCLFVFILVNFIITLISTVYNVATFITNRLYLSSIANIITSCLRVFLMCALFGFLPPNVAYVGLSTCICTFVGLLLNMYYTKLLVPDIQIKRIYICWIKIKEIISAGAWNSVTKLSQVLSDGLDLIITNLWISVYLMGELSIAQQLPTYISTLVSTLTNLFNPNLTMYYAKNDTDALVKELKLSMKFSSFIVNIIFCGIVVFGRYFVQLWVPNQDVDLIYHLMVVIMMSLVVSGVTTSLNNVFLVTNKLKTNSIFWLVISFVNVLMVFVLLNTTTLGIYAVAGVSKATGILGNLIFIPIYACWCLKIRWNTFYPLIFRYMATTILMMAVFFGLRTVCFKPTSWSMFLVVCMIAGIAGCLINFFVLLNSNERTIFKNKILSKVRKS
jgi:O-antigen/teichoic acid export membrane protein